MKAAMGALAALVLAACGGGSDSKHDTQSPSAQTQTISAPAISSTATTVGGSNLNMNNSGIDYLVQFNGTANITLSGSSNKVWITNNQAIGGFYLSGTGNIIVFRPGSTVMSLDVTGSGNTIYIPTGSSIVAKGAIENSNTVKIYTP